MTGRRRTATGFALAAATLLLAGCFDAPPVETGIGARVTLDRSVARVGDPIGVTVEVETPVGWKLQTPPAPSGGAFASDSVEVVAPIETAGGLRQHLLWVLRAREVGDHTLPWLEIPLIRPDGAVQLLRVGGVPLSVESVRAELPAREVVFDIRTAPPDLPTPPWVWALVAAVIALVLWSVRAIRRRARALRATTSALVEAGQSALAALDEAELERDARSFAGCVRAALVPFVARVWSVDAVSATPAELGAPIDGELLRILRAVELARFAPRPALAPLQPLAARARERVRDVANLRA